MAAVLAVNGGAVLGGRGGGTTVSINYRVLISMSSVKAC